MPVLENRKEHKMETEMETGIVFIHIGLLGAFVLPS